MIEKRREKWSCGESNPDLLVIEKTSDQTFPKSSDFVPIPLFVEVSDFKAGIFISNAQQLEKI
jgi:hypothetical protein